MSGDDAVERAAKLRSGGNDDPPSIDPSEWVHKNNRGGECPACDEDYDRALPDHLPECEEL